MVELVYASDLKSDDCNGHEGSSPSPSTRLVLKWLEEAMLKLDPESEEYDHLSDEWQALAQDIVFEDILNED
jgi:hypothetical protein